MNHFTYVYCQKYQTLIRLSPSGEELQRFFIPTSDVERICAILWQHSITKLNLEKE